MLPGVRVDADRPGPHYTIDMVELIKGQLPAGSELYFLMGFDSLRDLPGWHEPARLVAACHLAALRGTTSSWTGTSWKRRCPASANASPSSTCRSWRSCRTRSRPHVRAGRSIRYLVPDEVRGYIQEQKLYGEELSGRWASGRVGDFVLFLLSDSQRHFT